MRFSEKIVLDSEVMGGRPCVRGTRVTVGLIVGMLAGGWMKLLLDMNISPDW